MRATSSTSTVERLCDKHGAEPGAVVLALVELGLIGWSRAEHAIGAGRAARVALLAEAAQGTSRDSISPKMLEHAVREAARLPRELLVGWGGDD